MPPSMQTISNKSLTGQKIAAQLKQIQENEGLWHSIIVFLGALFLLGAIPFYPPYIDFILAGICGAVAYRTPWAGTLLSMLFAFPAVAYQSAVFGFAFMLLIALVLFTMFDNWLKISWVQILTMAPFSFGNLPFFGWLTVLGMAIGAMHFGSRKSILISIPSVMLIIFLSAIWVIPNNAYLPVNLDLYKPGDDLLKLNKGPTEIEALPSAIASSLGSLFSYEKISNINSALGTIIGTILKILFNDIGILQLIGWGITLYIVAYLSGQRGKWAQTIASFALIIPVSMYYGFSLVFAIAFKIEIAFAAASAIAVVAILDFFDVKISREEEVRRAERTASFGKFGLQDLAAGGEEKSMDDIGGYEDVKQELRDAILMPLERKELAYTYGIKPPSGILLFGPPGTGKTMLMRALAKELNYGFYYIKASDILSQWFGESLVGSEKILINEDGVIRFERIDNIVNNKINAKVLCFDENGNTEFRSICGHIKHIRKSLLYEIKTRTGRKIKVTADHSLFTLNGTKIESIETSKLISGVSYIAIPNKIRTTESPVEEIDFIEFLRKDDFGLFVKDVQPYIKLAINKIGKEKVSEILGYKNHSYLWQIIKRNVGIRTRNFLELMKETSINFDKSKISIGTNKKLPGIIKIDEKLATFIGLWVAEGSYNRKDTLRISTSKEESEMITSLCKELFGHVTPYRKKDSNGVDIYIGSKSLYIFFRHVLGLKDGADKKRVPEITYNLSKANLRALLRGYISGDGSFYKNAHGVGMIEASTASEQLANDLLYLFLYFGIVATAYDKKEWTGTISKRIMFTGQNWLTKFSEIGFLDERRGTKLNQYLKEVKWSRSEQIPINGELKSFIESKMPKWNSSNTIGKEMLNNYETEDLEFLEMIENDIYLDRVEEIKRIEDEEFVYDISVEPGQNFVAGFGGIFAHNSEKNVSEIFKIARTKAPSILFFDEIDSIGKKRGSYSTDEVTPRVLSVLLQEIDGAKTTAKPVMIIGATNIPDQLDAALLRPGRFDKIIYMHLPDKEARKEILKVHLRKVPYDNDIDFDKLAAKTERFSGADLKNVCKEAINKAAKEAGASGKIIPISMQHIMSVVQSVKPSTSLSSLESYDQFRLDFERRVGGKQEEKKEEAVRWEDVAGLNQVKQALLETIELPLLHEAEMKELKVNPSKGILLFGPPGTGKTLIVKAASNELNASFQNLSAAELMKQGYTQAVTIIKDTFNRARENTPAIIFVDEIETFAPARGVGSSEILGQFLTEMDGMRELKGVVVMAATNKPSLLDPAILRPGRFDKIFYIPPPNANDRAEIFKIHLGKFGEKLDFMRLAQATPGFSGADIASICQDYKMEALRAKIAGHEFVPETDDLLEIAKTRRPSITKQLLDEYNAFLEAYGERGAIRKKNNGSDTELKLESDEPEMHYR